MNSINFKRRIVFVSLVFGLTALVVLNIKDIYSLLDKIFTVLNPIILGCFIAFILNIIVENLEKRLLDKVNTKLVRKLKRPISILLSLAFFLLIILLVSRIIIPQISKFIEVFTNSFPNIYNEIMKFLAGLSNEFPSLQSKLLSSNLDAQAILKKLVSLSTTWAGDILNIINSIFSVIANCLNYSHLYPGWQGGAKEPVC